MAYNETYERTIMFKRSPRITTEEKDQIASIAWDALLTPVTKDPEIVVGLFDVLFGEEPATANH